MCPAGAVDTPGPVQGPVPGLWAIVPVKAFGQAKARLGSSLSDAQRAGLARAMAQDVLAAVLQAGVAERVCVLGAGDDARALVAEHKGLLWLDEATVAAGPGLNGAVTGAARQAAAQGACAVLVLHADMPLLQAADVQHIVHTWQALHGAPRVVMARSGDGGTNALLTEQPARFVFGYGRDSHARHLRACEALGAAVAQVTGTSVSLDIDSADDLVRLREAVQAGRCGAHTAAWLQALRAAAG